MHRHPVINAGVVLQGDRIEQANQSQHAGACQRGDGHADKRHEELVEMVGEQAATQPVAEAGADERAAPRAKAQ